jgi:hypothetical protein
MASRAGSRAVTSATAASAAGAAAGDVVGGAIVMTPGVGVPGRVVERLAPVSPARGTGGVTTVTAVRQVQSRTPVPVGLATSTAASSVAIGSHC